jgi:hypothetical protein
MEDNKLPSILGKILVINVAGIVLISMALIFFAVAQDYFFKYLYEAGERLYLLGLMGDWVLTTIESINTTYLLLPNYIDGLFLLMLISFIAGIIISSYYAEREGYFSVLSMLTFGSLIFLFFGGIFLQITDYIREEILYRVLPNLVYSLTIFNWYMDNIFIVNTLVFVICIVVNFIDFDTISLRFRKQKENVEEIT